MDLRGSTELVLLAAGLIFLAALLLGIVKYQQMATAENHLAHPYVDTAHRAALLYSFATLLVAVFVELSSWSEAVNGTAAGVLVFFFVGVIVGYGVMGLRRLTTNNFAEPQPNAVSVHAWMFALIVGEIGAFSVLLAGFVDARLV